MLQNPHVTQAAEDIDNDSATTTTQEPGQATLMVGYYIIYHTKIERWTPVVKNRYMSDSHELSGNLKSFILTLW